MLDWFHVFILSIVQGLTEFLPVSSSAHLIFVPKLLGWQDQGLAFDIAVHVGTLLAVIAYFRQDIKRMVPDFIRSLWGKTLTTQAKIVWAVGFATIPVGLVGLFAKDHIENYLRSPIVIAWSTIIFGIMLFVADKLSVRRRDEEHLNWRDILTIGCGQALSLLPGTSRSGITLTAGLARGLTRQAAARFSFLLSIPVILLAGSLETLTLVKEGEPIAWELLGFGVICSALSGYCCIHYFMTLLDKIGVTLFVIYRLLLGSFLLLYFL